MARNCPFIYCRLVSL